MHGVHWAYFHQSPARACHGGTASVGELLGCPQPTETITTRLEHGTFAGLPVLVLGADRVREGEDSRARTVAAGPMS